MFTEKDICQIEQHGLTVAQVEQQIENFRQGFPFLKIVRAASAGDGVVVLSPEQIASAVERYEAAAESLQIVKFVPASGAATRMFKELFEFVNDDKYTPGIERLLDNIEKFAFWSELSQYIVPDSPEEEIVEALEHALLGNCRCKDDGEVCEGCYALAYGILEEFHHLVRLIFYKVPFVYNHHQAFLVALDY